MFLHAGAYSTGRDFKEDVLVDERVWGIAQAVVYRHDRLVVLRPTKSLLTISVLRYPRTVRPISAFEAELGKTSVSAEDLAVVKSLIDKRRTEHPRLDDYLDPNYERLMDLIAAKIVDDNFAA
jgi:non-homologous end joining protein Ku